MLNYKKINFEIKFIKNFIKSYDFNINSQAYRSQSLDYTSPQSKVGEVVEVQKFLYTEFF
jgi:hypothetical protein